jgi:hypothetical protein
METLPLFKTDPIRVKSSNGKRRRPVQITPEMLSMSAQRKLETAIRQHKQKLTAEWQKALSAKVQELLTNTIGPRLRQEQKEAQRIMKSRKGIMDRKAYRKILSCLHPDRINDAALKPLYEEAFRLFTVMEKLLLDEKESPTQFVGIPATRQEWDVLKRQAQTARKAKQQTNKIQRTRF